MWQKRALTDVETWMLMMTIRRKMMMMICKGRWFTAGKSFSPDTDNASCDCVRIVKNCCQRWWWWWWYCIYDDEEEEEDVTQVCETQDQGFKLNYKKSCMNKNSGRRKNHSFWEFEGRYCGKLDLKVRRWTEASKIRKNLDVIWVMRWWQCVCERLVGLRGSNMGLVWVLQKATRGPACAPLRLQDGHQQDWGTKPPPSKWVSYELNNMS